MRVLQGVGSNRFILTTFLFLSLSTVEVLSEQWLVCDDCQNTSIAQTIERSSPGDTVVVLAGTYTGERIHIDRPLTLIGRDNPVIDVQHKSIEPVIIAADSVTLQGFTIRNVGMSYLEDLAGIRVQRRKEFSIRENRLENTMFGIYLEKASDGSILNNVVVGEAEEEVSSGNGIHAWHCSQLRIEGNRVENHRDGIYLEFVDSSRIVGNKSRDNLRYGLHFMFSNNDVYERNLFQRNGAGVAVMFSKFIDMYNNSFQDNWGTSSYGLLLKEIYDATIEGNRFQRNTTGIKVDGSTRISYLNNDFEKNGWAIKITGGCYNNKVSENNFLINAFDLVIESSKNDNTFDENYWSSYTGYDLDRDGIGDVPFRPVKLFSYIVTQAPEAMVLLRSLFVDILNLSEKVRPMFTPENVMDKRPRMTQYRRERA